MLEGGGARRGTAGRTRRLKAVFASIWSFVAGCGSGGLGGAWFGSGRLMVLGSIARKIGKVGVRGTT